jgi:hypothetical protein
MTGSLIFMKRVACVHRSSDGASSTRCARSSGRQKKMLFYTLI